LLNSASKGKANADTAGDHAYEAIGSDGDLTTLSTGSFKGLAHSTSGKAILYRTKEGGFVLRLENFETSNGPDVRVYLVQGTDAANDAVIKAGNFLDLGALKGNVGNQNYTIPADAQIERYQSVSIWCRRFNVNFGAAPLEPIAPGEPH
jgi:hypothetical protein